MADEATLLVKIKTVLDKNVFTKNLKNISKGVQDSFATKSPAAGDVVASKGGEKTGGGLLGGLKGIGKKLGNIIGIAKTALKWVGIIGLVMAAIEPAMKLVGGIMDMLKEFFRPISDMLMVLVMPLLMMLRPIVQMFRVLMAPFRQLAFQGLAAANLLISQGMQMNMEGVEGGGALIGAGLKGAMSSAGLLMTGFVNVMFKPLADLLGLGNRFEGMMENWTNTALQGIMKVQLKSELVQKLGDSLFDLSGDTIRSFFGTIDTYVEELNKKVGGFSLENFSGHLATAQKDLGTFFDPLIESLGEDGDIIKALGLAEEAMEALAEDFPNTVETMKTSMFDFVNDVKEKLKEEAGEMFEGLFERFTMPGLRKDLEETKGTSFLRKFWDTMTTSPETLGDAWLRGGPSLAEIHGWEKAIEKTTTKLNTYMDDIGLVAEEDRKGWLERTGLAKYYHGESIIPDLEEQGWIHRLNLTKEYMNPDTGKIIQSHTSGYSSMEKSANKFVEALKTAGKSIETIADQAASAARRAEASARSAASSSRSISILRMGGN